MRKVKLFCLSLVTGLLMSSNLLGMGTVNAQEIVSETGNVQKKSSKYIKYTNGDIVYYKENTKMSDVFNVCGTEETDQIITIDEISKAVIWAGAPYPDHTLVPGHTYVLNYGLVYKSNNSIKLLFKTNKTCDIVAGLRYTNNGNIYASKKVSCTANLLNVIEIPLEKGKQVDGFLLNTNGFNVELTNVSFEFIESLSV